MIAHVHDSFSASMCGWFFRVLGAWALILSPAIGQAPQISLETKASPASKNSASKSVESKSGPIHANGKSLVIVSVVEEETGQPIAKVPLKFSILGNGVSDQKKRSVFTDEKGQFRAEAPIGSFIFCTTETKLGYWDTPGKELLYLGPTPECPLANLIFKLKRGPIWNIQVTHDEGIPGISEYEGFVNEEEVDFLRTKLIQEGTFTFQSLWKQWTSPSPGSEVLFDRNGSGQFTQCGKSGKLLILLGAKSDNDYPLYKCLQPVVAEIVIDPKFNVTKVKSVSSIPGSNQTQLIDENGAKALVRKAKVTLQNGKLLLTYHLTGRNIPTQEVTGKVIDAHGGPIPDVDIRKILGTPTVSGELQGVTKTDSNGRFQIVVPANSPKPGDYLKLSFTKDGFVGIDSREIPLSKEPGKPIDLGKVSLVPGKTLPVRVVDQKDQPVVGATVSVQTEMDHFFAQTKLTVRTDEKGRVMLRNLPVGLIQVHLAQGSQSENHSMVVSPIESENTEIKFHIKPARPKPTFKQAESLVLGQSAPELVVDRWTDGKEHKLADFRGQVVVLNFWSMGWNPSVQGITALKEVMAQYQPKGVVFLSIHSPEGDLNQIKRFQKMLDWKALTGVDQGTTIFDGETIRRFGGQNPSTIIIDAEGKLVYHSRIPPKVTSHADQEKLENENKELAASLNIPWPLPSQGDAQSRSQRDKFHAAILGKEIEKVMAAKKK